MNSSSQRHVLLCDAYNLYLRAYNSFPTMSAHGYQMGGTIGFLKSLRKIIDELQPRAVHIIWESGGSARRRALFSEYKLNRKPEKLNRFYGDDIPDTEDNKKHQLITLIHLLKHVPLSQVYVPDCEADDVIAYLACTKFADQNKTIVSSDKDFYQLLSPTTRIFSPHKKTFITSDNVINDFRVTPGNFALAKALCGDQSDNIPGIKGIGFKTVAKLIPMLGLEQDILLSDVKNFCASHVNEAKKYKQILDSWDVVERNWRLVHLNGSMLSNSQVQKVEHAINTYKPTVDKMAFMRRLIEEGINDFNIDSFFYTINCIEDLTHK